MNIPKPIRLVIADSSPIFREGLRSVLESSSLMQVVAQAAHAREAVAANAQHQPDVLVLDLGIPEMDCLDAIKTIRTQNPQARILILTAYDGSEDIVRGLRAGASGYLLKDAAPQELIDAIRAVHAGKKYFAPEVAAKLAEHALNNPLSDSERLVLEQMAQGKSNPLIAEALVIAESTVKFHVNNILLKLDAANRTEAVLIGLKRGLVRLN